MTDAEKSAMVDRGIREIKIALAGEPFRDAPSWKDYEIGFRALLGFFIVGPSPESELVEVSDAEPELGLEPAADNVVQLTPPASVVPPVEEVAPPAPLPPVLSEEAPVEAAPVVVEPDATVPDDKPAE